jgi:hypothetical protein
LLNVKASVRKPVTSLSKPLLLNVEYSYPPTTSSSWFSAKRGVNVRSCWKFTFCRVRSACRARPPTAKPTGLACGMYVWRTEPV